MRRIVLSLTAAALALGLVGQASAKPVGVWEDAKGDAGNQGEPIPGAEHGGFDLVAGSIAKVKKDLHFTVEVAEMPPNGALPEGFRFLWHFNVGTEEYRLTIKSADIGKPDVIAGSGNERAGRIATAGDFRLETCANEPLPAVLTLNNCTAVEYVEGAFDTGSKTFSAIVPMSAIKAKVGSLIGGGTGGASGTNCQICWVPHYAERSLTPHTVIDSAAQTVTYKVPRK